MTRRIFPHFSFVLAIYLFPVAGGRAGGKGRNRDEFSVLFFKDRIASELGSSLSCSKAIVSELRVPCQVPSKVPYMLSRYALESLSAEFSVMHTLMKLSSPSPVSPLPSNDLLSFLCVVAIGEFAIGRWKRRRPAGGWEAS